MNNCLIVGTGKLGKRFYSYLHEQAAFSIVYTLSRSSIDFNQQHIVADLVTADLSKQPLPKVNTLFIILSPSSREPDNYRNTYLKASEKIVKQLQSINPQLQTVFISSSSVYGSQQLGEINEETKPQPSSFPGTILLEAEARLKQLCYSLSIIRPSGLYSSQRSRFIAVLEQPLTNEEKPLKFFNVIHEQDLCAIIYQSSQSKLALKVASDGQPFSKAEYQEAQFKPSSNKTHYRRIVSLHPTKNPLIYSSILRWKETNS